MTAIEEADVVESMAVEVSHVPAIIPAVPAVLAVTPTVQAAELVARLDVIRQAAAEAMKENVDFGVIPGTDKPTLLKPGAEKLGVLFQLDVQLACTKTWGPGDHLTVEARATVFHAPTGARVGYGEGLCSTREKKYGKRQQQRTCPTCGKDAIIKGKVEYGGGWLCFKKRGGCGAKFIDGYAPVESQQVGEIDNPELPDLWNCVTPETRILTRDLRWVPAGELETGDVLIGVAEENQTRYGRTYQDAVATVGGRFTDDLYEVVMDDGRMVRCNGEHRWLVRAVGEGAEWVSTQAIHEAASTTRTGRSRVWRIYSTGMPWSREDSLESGYLAGLLDADGSLDVSRSGRYHGVVVSFAQQHGGVLARFLGGLTARNFEHSQYPHKNLRMRVPVVKVHVRGGLREQMRLLGSIRPPRLMERWANLVNLGLRRFEGSLSTVAEIRRVGRGELVRLGTSSRTYIAEGLVCHNTVVKMAEKRARVDAVLAVTGASALFTQDIEDSAPHAEPTAPAGPPYGPAMNPEFAALASMAATKLCGADDAAKKLWANLKKNCGGYMPQAIADAVVMCAEATAATPLDPGSPEVN